MEKTRYTRLATDDRALHLLHCRALREVLQRPMVLSHWSAARLYGLAGLPPTVETIFATDPHEARVGRNYRISGSVLPEHHVCEVEGWPITTAARTVVDITRSLPFLPGVIVADSALSRGLARSSDLTDTVVECRHIEGNGAAARACVAARAGAQSPLETESRVVLMGLGLPEPQLQHEFHDDLGFVGRVDMYWEEQGVVGEVDGKVKYTDPYDDRSPGEVLWREKRREDRLRALGFSVIRWTAQDLRLNPHRIVAAFAAASGTAPAIRTPVARNVFAS